MDDLKQFKKTQINNYLSSINTEYINATQIKEDLALILQERPAVWFNYEQETLVTEDGSRTKKLEKLKSVTITFTYESIINGKLESIPVKETYILND